MVHRIALAGALAAGSIAFLAPRFGYAIMAPGAFAIAVILAAWLGWSAWRNEESDD